ncbi:MAG TPA: ATP-binding protein [Methanotrichaceae archaeon]|nr:ATP-binding protein [Methanotrichaceae archaeon]HQF16741.1 ATP-binding protein [Methanotrichaceae archaeon]HQI91373.1 ATP-binding protein [Methanotrichaceae archaeon]HQJ28661.1 ATP-binding protein [Methanotrichaceae archaeon]
MKGSVGIIVGETSPVQFKFLITRTIGRGDYVKVKIEGRDFVLAQVEEIKRSNSAFNLAHMERAGAPTTSREWVVAEARVLGVGHSGHLRLPSSPPRPGDEVFMAEEKMISSCLGLTRGEMYIGLLRGYDLRVTLDANTLVQKHCSVLAKTGSGKSYTAAVILEELLERGVALLVIDTHGEYSSMRLPNREGQFARFKIKPRGYDVVVYTPANQVLNPKADRPFRFDGMNLTARDLSRMMPEESSASLGLLYEAISALSAEADTYQLEDIIRQVEKSTSKGKWALISQLESLLEAGIFSGEPTHPSELLQRGRAAILDMTGVLPEMQSMIVARVLSELFDARKMGRVAPGMVVVEEAHNYIPERGSGRAASTSIIRTIAAEGRKFGLGLMIISQRPARVDKNVISQCNTQIIMRVTNPNDLKALSKGLEGMTAELEEEIKRLAPGTAMLVSNEIERPVVVAVRPRKSRHGGISTPIVAEEPLARPGIAEGEASGRRPPSRASGSILKKVFGPRRA